MSRFAAFFAVLLLAIPAWAQSGGSAIQTGTQTWMGSLAVQIRTVSGTVTVSAATDYFLAVDTTSSVATINLPASPANGLTYLIKDVKGNDATNNITVTPASGTIDGAATYVMKTSTAAPYDAIGVTYVSGVGWSVN